MIFERISSSPRNRSDTAAALKLALQIEMAEQLPRSDNDYDISARSFINFWLLRNGCLDQDFSWTKYDSTWYSGNDIERMLHQTTMFLEETCNDLLTLVDERQRFKPAPEMEWEVQFIHRTVFDFLRGEDNIRLIDELAPMHFSDQNFICDLTKLRCFHLLHDQTDLCSMVEGGFLAVSKWCIEQTPKDTRFLSACEDLLVASFKKCCRCFGLDHLHEDMFWICTKLRLRRYLLDTCSTHPNFSVFGDADADAEYRTSPLFDVIKRSRRSGTRHRTPSLPHGSRVRYRYNRTGCLPMGVGNDQTR